MPNCLCEFAPDIWLADGPTVVANAGFHYPTRMAVLRLSCGRLFVWSPTALGRELRAEVDALGPVAFIVAPNSLHHVFVAEWRDAYPEARLYAAPGLRAKRKDIVFDDDLTDVPPAGWASDIDQVVVPNALTTEVVFFHRKSRTVIFTDLIQQFPSGWFSGWRGVVARLDRMVSSTPAVPRKFRLGFTDRHAARDAIRRIVDWPADRLIMAHGNPVRREGRAAIAQAFGWLGLPQLPSTTHKSISDSGM